VDRETALDSIKANVQNDNLIKHMLATEAIMRALAGRLGEDEEEWGLAGLLHDIDVELTESDPESHSKLGADLARDLGASETVCRAVLCHNEVHGIPCDTLMSKALCCTDPLTGLITAAALVRPDKKLEGLTTESLMKRFSEKRFAAGAKRENIAACEEIDIGLEEFVSLGLEAMKGAADELGL
jgi:putative nucleotidyltransferase with HDIG domain